MHLQVLHRQDWTRARKTWLQLLRTKRHPQYSDKNYQTRQKSIWKERLKAESRNWCVNINTVRDLRSSGL
jgi:hypothetical protein